MTVFQHDGDPTGDPTIDGHFVGSVGGIRYSHESGRLQWSTSAALMHGGGPDVAPTFESFAEFVHPDDRATVIGALERFADGKPVRSHYRLIHRAGETRWVVMATDPLTDATGGDNEPSGFVIDVTDAVQSGITSAVSAMFESRATIEQVKGVLMVCHGLTADQAFNVLTRCSQDTNTKVRDLSRRFLTVVSGGSTAINRALVDRGLLTASLELAAGGDRASSPQPAA
jgi:PAS domain S-box-containing protein